MNVRFLDARIRWLVVAVLAMTTVSVPADDLVPFSDEFNDASTLSLWQRVYAVEGWNANQLELQDINATRPGRMVMMPYTSTWYDDYRGELTFKTISGDFVVTTAVSVSQRNGTGAPRSEFSLGGIMVRSPRQITPQTWHPGGENYLFLSLGAADHPGSFQFEVKSTVSSNSELFITPAPGGQALIQFARIGPYFIALRNSDGAWVVHRRYYRPDLPTTLQVGMTTYTDYPTASSYPPFVQNSSVIHAGFPDLVAAFDYFRFERPVVPASLAGADLSNSSGVPDATLLAFLGTNATANQPRVVEQPHDLAVARGGAATFTVSTSGETPLSFQWSKDGVPIAATSSATLNLSNVQFQDAGTYSVTVSNPAGTATSQPARLSIVGSGRRRAAGR